MFPPLKNVDAPSLTFFREPAVITSGYSTKWGPQTIAKLVQISPITMVHGELITPITMVYGTYNL